MMPLAAPLKITKMFLDPFNAKYNHLVSGNILPTLFSQLLKLYPFLNIFFFENAFEKKKDVFTNICFFFYYNSVGKEPIHHLSFKIVLVVK